jgi:hypothetical protein
MCEARGDAPYLRLTSHICQPSEERALSGLLAPPITDDEASLSLKVLSASDRIARERSSLMGHGDPVAVLRMPTIAPIEPATLSLTDGGVSRREALEERVHLLCELPCLRDLGA